VADFGSLTFKELHLFPRAVFALGAVILAYGIVRDKPAHFFSGLALFFGAIGINILYDLHRTKTGKDTSAIEKKWLIGFCAASFLVVAIAFAFYWLILIR
jgi:hypothetical protein